jgi:hypothetical protein
MLGECKKPGKRKRGKDGLNSFWHVVFGMLAYCIKVGIPVYVLCTKCTTFVT